MIPDFTLPLLHAAVSTCIFLSGCALEPQARTPAIIEISPAPESIVEASLSDMLDSALVIEESTRREHDNWLLITGAVRAVNGGEFDFADTVYQSAVDKGAFENLYMALLEKDSSLAPYQLIELSFGSTDTPIEQWIQQYSVPPELFGYYRGTESLQW